MKNARVVLRPATLEDIPTLERWDLEPHVIEATTDQPDAVKAFDDLLDWREELVAQNEHTQFFIAEVEGKPIGAMQMIDPHLEPTHYWGEIEPNLRALDIWIGEKAYLGKGYGTEMMSQAINRCFEDPGVKAIVIDPLNSNKRAIQFYQKLGFRAVGRHLFNDKDDCLVHRLERTEWLA